MKTGTFFLLLALLPLLHADGGNSTIINIDVSGIINAIADLPGKMAEGLFSYAVSGLTTTSQQLADYSFRFIFANPDPRWFCPQYNGIMAIVETLYSLALMALALHFILRSGDAEGRASAKKWLENMLAMIVVLSFSVQLFSAMLDLDASLAAGFAGDSVHGIFSGPMAFPSLVLAAVMLLAISTGLMLTFATLLLRYLMIPFLLFLFPLAIFLYFTPPTQKWGRAFLSVIAAVVFMTALDAMLLLALGSLFNTPDPTLADPLIRAIAVFAGFSALGLANLAVFILALLSIIFQNNMVRSAVGLVVAGKVLAR